MRINGSIVYSSDLFVLSLKDTMCNGSNLSSYVTCVTKMRLAIVILIIELLDFYFKSVLGWIILFQLLSFEVLQAWYKYLSYMYVI